MPGRKRERVSNLLAQDNIVSYSSTFNKSLLGVKNFVGEMGL
jgi:hypothetical protein